MTATPPWIAQQTAHLLAQRGHAWLLQGPSGLGQLDLALSLVRAWLCESPSAQGACGTCPSCHALAVHTHADVCMLMPETTLLALGWPLDEKAQKEIDDKKRKPSKDIRVEAMREAVEFSQRTSARGRGKAVLVFPAERMNHVTANALLKTLEEPPGDVRFVLATEAAHQLLPTIRSRCLVHTLHWPPAADALAWLEAQGVPATEAEKLLRASGGRPLDAWRDAQSGRGSELWQNLPKAMWHGDTQWVKDFSPSELLDALQKLCHDLMVVSSGAEPRFFMRSDLPSQMPPLSALSPWAKSLAQARLSAEHPFNAGLMLEALVSQAQTAMRHVH
jgi:DNA polymerase-3 subunit delta'